MKGITARPEKIKRKTDPLDWRRVQDKTELELSAEIWEFLEDYKV